MEPGFQILYDERPCLVVCKPPGLATQAPPGIDSLEVRVKAFLAGRAERPGEVYLGVPHRLDRPASGAIVFATRRRAAQRSGPAVRASHGEEAVLGLGRRAARSARRHVAGLPRKVYGRPQAEIVPPEHPEGRLAVLHYRTLAVGRLGAAGWRSSWRPDGRTRSASKRRRGAVRCWAISSTGPRRPLVRSTPTSGCGRSRCTPGLGVPASGDQAAGFGDCADAGVLAAIVAACGFAVFRVQYGSNVRSRKREESLSGKSQWLSPTILIWTAYGYWLPNDPRGSMSKTIACDVIAELGALHYGRKQVQPSAREIKEFREQSRGVLKHPLLDFKVAGLPDHRRRIGSSDPRAQLHLLRLRHHARPRSCSDPQAQALRPKTCSRTCKPPAACGFAARDCGRPTIPFGEVPVGKYFWTPPLTSGGRSVILTKIRRNGGCRGSVGRL